MGDGLKAVIDVGTNSIKLLVARLKNGRMEIVADFIAVSRLGEGSADTGLLAPEAMERTASAMKSMCGEARRLGADEIISVGTQALRASGNRGEFIDMAESVCGVKIRVISGEEEAELSFRAASSSSGNNADENVLVFDVGGGSCEIILGRVNDIARRASVPVGALSLYRNFFVTPDGAVTGDALNEAESYVSSLCAEMDIWRGFDPGSADICVGVGGTVTTLAAVSLSLESGKSEIDGAVLGSAEISRQIALYASTDIKSRKKIAGLPAERADIILPGACIVRSLMGMARMDELVASSRGLRHGLMEQMLLGY
jgi:exopolyphosphatase/guanosine-5'-triphosphate,3'-diphosphate pyrophosphatase